MTEGGPRRFLTDGRVLLAVTFAAAILAFTGPLMAYDLWWHLRAAQQILADRAVPHADPFSFTAAGRPWVYHSWLSGLVLYGAWSAFGPKGVIFLRSLLIALSLVVAWFVARRRGVGVALASVLVLAACLQLELRALARPYLFSFLLFAVFVFVLDRAVSEERPAGPDVRRFLWGKGGRLALLPLLTALWANLHAGFLVGLLLLGAYGAGELARLAALPGRRSLASTLVRDAAGARFRAMFGVGVLCLAASMLTPYGPGVLLYPFRLMFGVKLVSKVQEWQPTPLSGKFAVFWAMLVFGALVLARSVLLRAASGRLRADLGRLVTDLLLMAGFAFLAVGAVRHMAWFLLLAPSVLGSHLTYRTSEDADATERPVYAVAAWVLALVVGFWPLVSSGSPKLGVSERHTPVRACDYIESVGLMLKPYNSYEWGGYLTWRFWPRMRVFIDGRCLVYRDDIIGDALAVEKGDGRWRQVLEKWGVEMLFVRYRKRDAAHLFADGRWRCIYWDDLAVIGLRSDLLPAWADRVREYPLSNPVVFEQ